MILTHQLAPHKLDAPKETLRKRELWLELNDEQSGGINGGGTQVNTNININVLTNIGFQTNIATIIGASGTIYQSNFFRR